MAGRPVGLRPVRSACRPLGGHLSDVRRVLSVSRPQLHGRAGGDRGSYRASRPLAAAKMGAQSHLCVRPRAEARTCPPPDSQQTSLWSPHMESLWISCGPFKDLLRLP